MRETSLSVLCKSVLKNVMANELVEVGAEAASWSTLCTVDIPEPQAAQALLLRFT
jgi:hypothetical protein